MGKVEQHNKAQQRSNTAWVLVAVAVAILLAWGQLSDTSADELSAEQNHYCKMVAEGTWPDYKGTYDESCK